MPRKKHQKCIRMLKIQQLISVLSSFKCATYNILLSCSQCSKQGFSDGVFVGKWSKDVVYTYSTGGMLDTLYLSKRF